MSNDFASMMQQQSAGGEHVRTSTRLRPGQSVTGTVVQIGQDYVFVDIGATTEGRIDRRELEDKAGEISVHPGDSLRASVISVDDVTGPKLSVSFGRGRGRLDEGALEAARDARVAVEGVVGPAVKGGVEVRVLGARAFCPASQLSQEFVADLSSLEGQKLEFLILEVKNGGRDVIVSRKALLVAQQSRETERVLSELQVGGDYPAKVVSIQKYGAFVELGGGVEGLVHISELAHGRVDRVEDLLRVGEEITVRLLALQPGEKGGAPKLRLSLRALADAGEAKPEPERGEVLTGTVSKVTQFGVFVDTPKGTGLVPTRELGTPRNSDSRRMFPIGKEVSVVLVSKDSGRGLTFSMSRVADVEERQNFREFSRTQQTQREDAGSLGSFGALLRQELKLPDAPPRAPHPEPVASKEAAAELVRPQPAPVPAPPGPAPVRPAGPGPTAAAPRGPQPGDRTRVDRSPPAAPTPPKSEGDGRASNLGVVRGRRRPSDRG